MEKENGWRRSSAWERSCIPKRGGGGGGGGVLLGKDPVFPGEEEEEEEKEEKEEGSLGKIPDSQAWRRRAPWHSHNRQMRLLPSSISSCTLSLDVAISACAESTAQMKVSTVPPMAV
ncbi:UNVERIFIED_CONTAM: hypothetical protein FKN15_038405 [Acipenser sinensis]